MQNENRKFKNPEFRRIYLDQYFSTDIEIDSNDFKIALRFIKQFEINFEDDVLLNIESSSDAFLVQYIEFLKFLRKNNYILNF